MTPKELKSLLDKNTPCQVIDVREPYEFEEMNIGAVLIPMAEIMDRNNEIPKDKKVIIHCKTGKRAAAVIDALEREFGFNNLYNLQGGIVAYLEEFPQ